MKIFQLLILVSTVFIACNQSRSEKSNKNEPDEKFNDQSVPVEPCDIVSWGYLPVITHGFSKPEHQEVVVETYIKNSNFDSIIKRYNLKNDSQIRDSLRQERSFSLPSEVNSAVDLKIIIGKIVYLITELKTGWTARYGNEFIGYECIIQNYLINGLKEGGNIHLKNPSFKYPWEK